MKIFGPWAGWTLFRCDAKQDLLKRMIRYRLTNYDWECKLPDRGQPYPPKPRVRYQLTKQVVNRRIIVGDKYLFPARKIVYK